MSKRIFGTLSDGRAVELYEIGSDAMTCRVMTRGAAIVDLIYDGINVVGGFDTLEDYLADTSHQGALIGRVANRVGGARFTMDGTVYTLPDNDGGNCLHGGDGFDHRLFSVTDATDSSVTMEYTSPDGEEGFPSALHVKVTYTVVGGDLVIAYEATPDGKTPIALTNHTYFNLNGLGGTVEGHTVWIDADRYTEVDASLIPNGNRPCVEGSAFDFRTPHTIGERIGGDFIGYDHNYILNGTYRERVHGYDLARAAYVTGDALALTVLTDQEGMQFYIGNFLEGTPPFRGGTPRILHGAFCMETQTEPDCINHGRAFYEAGETYRHVTVYRLSRKRDV